MRLSEIGGASRYDAPVRTEDLVRLIRNQFLAAIERHRREELAVWQLRHPFVRSVDSGVLFYVIVPARDIGIANRPINRDSFLRIRLEVEIAPAITLAAPHQ